MKLTRREFGLGALATGGIAGMPLGARAAQTLIYANAGNAKSSSNMFAAKWLKAVEERTGGELKFEIKAGTLGGEKDILDGCSLGTVHIYNGAYTGLREFDVFYTPYFARDSNHAQKIVYDLLYDRLTEAVSNRYNVHFMSIARAGPWKLFLKKKIDSFGDLKGMKIRAPQIEGVVAGLEQLGAKPTVIPFNEVYSALQQGVVDGMATLGNLGISQKFYEVAKYVVRNDWGIGLDKQMMNLDTWNALSDAHKKVLTETFRELEPTEFFGATIAREESDFKKWEELNGPGTVLSLDGSEAQKLLKPAVAKLADEIFGAGTYEKIQAL
ncbi:MAG: TRAP transporter substrate-binding protein [Alphaproteobacteria bacterium]|nr:MAG: TRAP transporter substrate-binding protein [Alphaproteobacteria bacterium]